MKALVTGASSGIGRELSIGLSKKGYDIIAVGRDKDKLNETKRCVENNKRKCFVEETDLSKTDNCYKLYEKYPNIDILINDAGFGYAGYFEDIDIDIELEMIQTNIVALHCLTKLYYKQMLKKDKGYILNVASIAGFMPGPLMATYYSTKNYVVRLSQSLRKELKEKSSSVKISVLCPGPVNTNFNSVANVEFKLPSKTSEEVALYTLKQMDKNKFYIIPGVLEKLTHCISKILPSKILANLSFKNQREKINKKKEKEKDKK